MQESTNAHRPIQGESQITRLDHTGPAGYRVTASRTLPADAPGGEALVASLIDDPKHGPTISLVDSIGSRDSAFPAWLLDPDEADALSGHLRELAAAGRSAQAGAAKPSTNQECGPRQAAGGVRQLDPFVAECPAWCWDGDGTPRHQAEEHAEDRMHYSRFYADHLPLELEAGFRDRRGEVHPARLEVYLQQHYRAAEAEVRLDRDGAATLRLTVAEAGQLISALQGAIAAATT